MRSIEISAKSIEDAIKLALQELKLERDQVEVEVLEQPSKGFFGIIGSKNAKVKVKEKYDPISKAEKFMLKIFECLKLKASINIKKNKEYVVFDIYGENLGILIGRRGDTLDSLQFLLNLVVNKNVENNKRVKIILDVEGYRERRKETLINLAHRLADKAKRTGRKVILEPMSPQERRIIHLTLQDNGEITTYSEGEEPYRKVIIVPKK